VRRCALAPLLGHGLMTLILKIPILEFLYCNSHTRTLSPMLTNPTSEFLGPRRHPKGTIAIHDVAGIIGSLE
jgi:hypothetical protein